MLSNTLSVKNISKLLSIEDTLCDYQSTFDNMTLHNDDVIPYHKSYHSHHIIFFIMWIKILTNFANDLFTTFHFGLPGAIGTIAHKKRFKDFFYIVINKTCFALEVTHWLITSHTATLLSGNKCDGQFENKHNNDKFSVMRVLNNWCRSIISTFCCNPYATNYCMNSWLTTLWNRQTKVSFYGLLYPATYHDQVYTNRYVLSVKTLITAVFVILCWLILKWRNMFSAFPSVRTFWSIIKAKVMDFDIITHIKYKFFDIQHFYDGMYHSCLVIKRIIMSLFTVKSSCTGCDPLPCDISETSSTMCDNFVDSSAFDLGIDDNNELAICEEATEHYQSHCILVNIPRKVPLFKIEGSDHPDAVEGVELVVNSTRCVQLSNIVTLHQTLNIIKHSYDGIPSCDNDSQDIVSPCECVEFMLEPHTQAEYRNADHQFLQDENDLVTGSLISCFPPHDDILDINTSHREFHQSPAKDDCIKISPSQEQTNQSYRDLDDNKNTKGSLENSKGSEDDDSDCDNNNIECNGYEKYCGVAECQSFDTSSCSRAEETVWSSNSDGDNGVLLTGTYTISEAYGSDQVVLSLIDQVLCIHCDDSSHEVVSPYACDDGLTLDSHTQAECRNADHQFLRDENDLVTGNLFSYFPPLDNLVDINISRREFHKGPAEDDSIKVSSSQEQTNQSDHDLDDNKNCSLENTEGSEDDDSDCDNDNIECNGVYGKYCGVAECQSFNTSSNELVVCSRAEEIVWSSNSDGGNELLLTGTYTINEAYGSDQVVLSLIGQVLCIHTCSDTSRPIGGEHVNKPKVNSNQPSVFEDIVNRSNVDQFNQQTVSLEASHFPSAARTEQRRHQQITSTDDTHIERDGPSRNDTYITPEGQSIIAKDATRTEQRRHQPVTSTNDTHVERDGALRDDVTPQGQSIITNDAIATVGPQIIREKPTQSLQIPTVGPQYTTSYDTKFSGSPTMPYEEVKQRSKAKTTFLQHEVEDRSQQALKQTTVQNVHPLIPQLTNQSAASNTTTSKPKALPKRSCMVAGSTQYPLTPNLLAHPHMDHFFVKERKEIKPGHFLAKLVLQHHYLIM